MVDLQILEAAAAPAADPCERYESSRAADVDIALQSALDPLIFHPFAVHDFALDGPYDWVSEQSELRQFYEQVLRVVDRQQQPLIQQMEQHTHDQAYFLFLYNPIPLYAVNKSVTFVPQTTTLLGLAGTSWQMRIPVRQTAAQQALWGTAPPC